MNPVSARLSSKVTIAPHVSFHNLDGEAVMLNLESGKYYGLDPVGTRMWELISEHGLLESVFRALLDEYDVSEERLEGDLLKLVDRLAANGLVLIGDEENSASSTS